MAFANLLVAIASVAFILEGNFTISYLLSKIRLKKNFLNLLQDFLYKHRILVGKGNFKRW